ncbi:hypothetical protein HanIR_Chr06g0269551 [Helianthus annuus]|nr:hypothetical protein HanIR_Chr06g0269551 [Helianthus annuus]
MHDCIFYLHTMGLSVCYLYGPKMFVCYNVITCFATSQKRYTQKETGEKRCERKQREKERERSGAGESPATGPTRARLPPTETKSPSLGFPARVPIKFWQFPVTSGEVPVRFRRIFRCRSVFVVRYHTSPQTSSWTCHVDVCLRL